MLSRKHVCELGPIKDMARAMAMFLPWAVAWDRPMARAIRDETKILTILSSTEITLSVLPILLVATLIQIKFTQINGLSAISPYVHFGRTTNP